MLNTNKTSSANNDHYKITLPKFDRSLFFGENKNIGTDPGKILNEIGVNKNDVVVDFGCGVGFFILDSGVRVGEGGKVIAVDIDQNMLESVKKKAMESGLKNIYGIKADLETPGATKLGNESADLVLVINLLYLVNKKQEVINEAARILKSGGRLAVMDWKDKSDKTMLEKHQIISSTEIKNMARKAELSLQKNFEAGISHEVNVFTKK